MGAMVSSRVPLVDRDVAVIRVLDHRHAADRDVEYFRDERHSPFLHLVHKGFEVRHFKGHDGSLLTVPPLIDFDSDGFLLGLFGLRHADLEYPVLKGRLHLIGLHVTGQNHGSCKCAKGPFAGGSA